MSECRVLRVPGMKWQTRRGGKVSWPAKVTVEKRNKPKEVRKSDGPNRIGLWGTNDSAA